MDHLHHESNRLIVKKVFSTISILVRLIIIYQIRKMMARKQAKKKIYDVVDASERSLQKVHK